MRRAVLIMSILAGGIAVVALVYFSTGRSTRHAVAVTAVVDTTAPSTGSDWNVSVTRAAAIEAVQRLTAEVDPKSTASAKLMTYGDINSVLAPSSSDAVSGTRKIWAIEVIGAVRPQFARGEVFSWAIFAVDADDGSVVATWAKLGELSPRGK